MTSGQTCGGVLMVHHAFDEYEAEPLIDDGVGAVLATSFTVVSEIYGSFESSGLVRRSRLFRIFAEDRRTDDDFVYDSDFRSSAAMLLVVQSSMILPIGQLKFIRNH